MSSIKLAFLKPVSWHRDQYRRSPAEDRRHETDVPGLILHLSVAGLAARLESLLLSGLGDCRVGTGSHFLPIFLFLLPTARES
jgi:hypothetical protein